MTQPTLTPARGRLLIVLAALLWSLSGAFTKLLTKPTWFGVDEPPIEPWQVGHMAVPVQIVCYRILFAGAVLLPTLRPSQLRVKPIMFVMLGCFALMNITFITAQALGSAANAILLQYSAPLWLYLAGVFWLGEKPDRRSTICLFLGLAGIGIILGGGWQAGSPLVLAMALASGLLYAGVLLCLRLLRSMPAGWLTVWNHLLGGLLFLPFVLMLHPPTWQQFVVLFLFGAIQMGLAYFLMARGLQSVSPQEAGTITLLEPILNPVWAYLVSGETPDSYLTYVGGAVILAALAWCYWPFQKPAASDSGTPHGSS